MRINLVIILKIVAGIICQGEKLSTEGWKSRELESENIEQCSIDKVYFRYSYLLCGFFEFSELLERKVRFQSTRLSDCIIDTFSLYLELRTLFLKLKFIYYDKTFLFFGHNLFFGFRFL
jgi:hypothetical protein